MKISESELLFWVNCNMIQIQIFILVLLIGKEASIDVLVFIKWYHNKSYGEEKYLLIYAIYYLFKLHC